MLGVHLEKLIDVMKLENCTPDINVTDRCIYVGDINRPAIQLSGFFDFFDLKRIQIIGNVEKSYLDSLGYDIGLKRFEELLKFNVPCIILCNQIELSQEYIQLANTYQIPLLRTSVKTSIFMSEVIRWLYSELAPTISMHGVLLDIYGEGVLIMGDSGIGKSEIALELVTRGHRLITDDAVIIKKIDSETLIGYSTEVLQDFIELRGIGIISIKELYGIESIKKTQTIDLVIQLVEWSIDSQGTKNPEHEYINILDTNIVKYTIPMAVGRNLAIICETAALNHRKANME